jgi:hypothetical protein
MIQVGTNSQASIITVLFQQASIIPPDSSTELHHLTRTERLFSPMLLNPALWYIYILTWRPKAGIVKSEETSIARQLLGIHIPAATNTQATIELVPLLCNGAVNTPSQQYRGCIFCVVSAEVLLKGQKRSFELVQFREASLPGYEPGSRELELGRVFGVGKLAE